MVVVVVDLLGEIAGCLMLKELGFSNQDLIWLINCLPLMLVYACVFTDPV